MYVNSGMKIEDMHRRLPNFLEKHPSVPDVILHVGSNNVRDDTLEELINKFERLINTVEMHAKDNTFHLLEIPPQSCSDCLAKVSEINTYLRLRCKDSCNVNFWDTNLLYSHLKKDGIHLTNLGKNELATVISELVKRVVTSVFPLKVPQLLT